MKIYRDMILKTACLLIITALFACSVKNEAPGTPQVIRKKISSVSSAPPKTMPEKQKQSEKPLAEKYSPQKTIAVLPGLKPGNRVIKTALYTTEGKLDPFKPLLEEPKIDPLANRGRPDKPPAKPIRPCPENTPLTQVSISQLKLVAVVRAESGNWALVQEPTNKGYVISPDTCIGVNSGRVSQILADRVVIEEKFEDYKDAGNHQWEKIETTRKIEMKLQKPEGV